ncbi:MAG: phospholipid carrier-dependent glycosyltransferase [Acidobacteria bacterium]|nr:MAG: phospholipid carrier-dependent glycosyltransferase [Acidobacteriota bacterium]
MPTSTLLSLALVAVTATAAWATADLLVGRFWPFPHWALRTAALTCAGLLIWSHLIFGLACLHLANRAAFIAVLVLLVLTAGIGLARAAVAARRRGVNPSLSPTFQLLLLGVILYFGWMTATASLPPTSTDELAYHLEVPRRFLESGGQPFFQDNIYAYYPQFGEMLFLFGLAFRLETAARLFHLLFVLLLALAIFGYSRQYLDRLYSAVATAVFLAIPSVMVVGVTAYVDVMFACFAFLALTALLRFFETEGLSWLLLAGVMGGGACSVKYTGIQFVMLLLLLLLFEQLRRKRRWRQDAGILLVLTAVLVASPYYARNFRLTGWPLFPFSLPLFSLSPGVNWDRERAALLLKFLTDFGVASQSSFVDRLLGPILVFIKGRFSGMHAYQGVASPLFLLVPLLWWRVRPKPAPLKQLLVFSALFLGYWTLTTQQVRFLLPVLPGLALLLAVGLKAVGSRGLHAMVWLLLAANLAIGVNHILEYDPIPYWTGQESKSSYISRHVSAYGTYQDVSGIVGQEGRVYMVCASNLLYYFDSPVRTDYLFEDYRFGQVVSASTKPLEILAFLQSQGATHLLLNEGILTHPQAGLPLNDQKKLGEFLGLLTTEVYRRGSFRLFRLRVLAAPEQRSNLSKWPGMSQSPMDGLARCSFSTPPVSRR